MATNNFDQDDQQDKLAFDVNGDFSEIQSIRKMRTRRPRSQIIGISVGSVLIMSIIAVTVWLATTSNISQATNVVANYCNALVNHNFSQAQKYILPNSTILMSDVPQQQVKYAELDVLQQQVKYAEEENQGPLVGCKIFNGKDTPYPGGEQFFVEVHKDKDGIGYLVQDPANSYTTKEVVSFQMEFFFQKPIAPTTYLTGSCQVLSTGNQQWLIDDSCSIDECPSPRWQEGGGIGPECDPPNVVGQPWICLIGMCQGERWQ